jgi:hypothetical protein
VVQVWPITRLFPRRLDDYPPNRADTVDLKYPAVALRSNPGLRELIPKGFPVFNCNVIAR